ncbi:MAG TPA: hypothetical protein DCS42_01335 [Nitrospiraceae bacterium]|jgi:hypothetical protein|nr:MAG: hypothetical protein A2X57_02740 [Nitrospirae bacterium GWD2_57_8]HAS52842.1 hypothetical protein [Nitrospiraceae bacterium]
MHTWQFKEDRNLAVFCLRSIVKAGAVSLYGSHDSEDGMWQFLDGTEPTEPNAMIISLGEVVDLDPTVVELAGLPPGWYTMRSSRNDEWVFRKTERAGA